MGLVGAKAVILSCGPKCIAAELGGRDSLQPTPITMLHEPEIKIHIPVRMFRGFCA